METYYVVNMVGDYIKNKCMRTQFDNYENAMNYARNWLSYFKECFTNKNAKITQYAPYKIIYYNRKNLKRWRFKNKYNYIEVDLTLETIEKGE